jgi:hypothetical protein
MFGEWSTKSLFCGWPLAYVAQDGAENLEFPDISCWDTLVIDGSWHWKDSDAAESIIQRAQAVGKHIHICDVNFWRQYFRFAKLSGSRMWTCDGTRNNFWGASVLEE